MPEAHHRGNRYKTPYSLALQQPPKCPTVINLFPDFRGHGQGSGPEGSDFCLCGDEVVKTDEQALCWQNQKTVCDDIESGCGSNTIGGWWDFEFHAQGDGWNNPRFRRSEDGSWTEREVGEVYLLDFLKQSRGLSISNAQSATESRYGHHRGGAATHQTFSTWLYISEEKLNELETPALALQGESKGPSSIAITLKKAGFAGGIWSLSALPLVHSRDTEYYDFIGSQISSGESFSVSIDNSDEIHLTPGWYFLRVDYVFRNVESPAGMNLKFVNPFSLGEEKKHF